MEIYKLTNGTSLHMVSVTNDLQYKTMQITLGIYPTHGEVCTMDCPEELEPLSIAYNGDAYAAVRNLSLPGIVQLIKDAKIVRDKEKNDHAVIVENSRAAAERAGLEFILPQEAPLTHPALEAVFKIVDSRGAKP